MGRYVDDYRDTPVECWVDSHCHLCNSPLTEHLQEEIDSAREEKKGHSKYSKYKELFHHHKAPIIIYLDLSIPFYYIDK